MPRQRRLPNLDLVLLPVLRREPQHLQHRMSTMISTMMTMTVVIAPTMDMITLPIAEMMSLMPEPIAETIEPMIQLGR